MKMLKFNKGGGFHVKGLVELEAMGMDKKWSIKVIQLDVRMKYWR
jgi:hypothetical protein